jgi:hypothetical protein
MRVKDSGPLFLRPDAGEKAASVMHLSEAKRSMLLCIGEARMTFFLEPMEARLRSEVKITECRRLCSSNHWKVSDRRDRGTDTYFFPALTSAVVSDQHYGIYMLLQLS